MLLYSDDIRNKKTTPGNDAPSRRKSISILPVSVSYDILYINKDEIKIIYAGNIID